MYARFLSHREEILADSSSSSQRTWQTGDRRSPPTEASEGRRRTRPRHGSIRAPPSASNSNGGSRPSSFTNAASSTSQQQSTTARERVNPPPFPIRWLPFPHAPPSLTPLFARQYSPLSYYRPYNYSGSGPRQSAAPAVTLHVEPSNLGPPSTLNNAPFHPGFGPPPLVSDPLDGGALRPGMPFVEPPSIEVTGTLPRVPGMPHFHELPPLGPMDGPNYPPMPHGSDDRSAPLEYWDGRQI